MTNHLLLSPLSILIYYLFLHSALQKHIFQRKIDPYVILGVFFIHRRHKAL